MPQKVFICHSETDNALANNICRLLEAEGLPCWIAPRDVPIGSQWAEAITGAIDECGVFMLVFTTHSNSSNQVLREVERAVRREKCIVNYRAENIPCSNALDYYLAVHQWFDPAGPTVEVDVKRLAVQVARICGSGTQTRTATWGQASSGQAYPGQAWAARPAPAYEPRADAVVKLRWEAQKLATLPVMSTIADVVAPMNMVTVSVDGEAVAKTPFVRAFSFERRLPLGDHVIELKRPMVGARRYPVRVDQPGEYVVRFGRNAMTNNFTKACEISRGGVAPVSVKGSSRVPMWAIILICVFVLAVLGALMQNSPGY